ncbi:MAG: outer membrane lipoprotein carrier protein LolA [Acidobacteria bacterium]|nr:outer membrane lipoprotein carrier protein LolA [Acidobacteriota bacterium]
MKCRILALLVSVLWAGSLGAQQDRRLELVLQKMDAFGRQFRTLTADLEQRKYTHILTEFDPEEKGKIYYVKAAHGTSKLRREIHSPSESILIISGNTALVYRPQIKEAQRISLGKHQDKAEFLVVGFGQSSSTLREVYQVRYLGEEKVQGTETAVLELRPRSDRVAALFAVIKLWVDLKRGLPIQQQLTEPNQDYLMIRFSRLQVNKPISNSKFTVKLPADVQVVG